MMKRQMFTLLEMVIVVVIIALLAGVVAPFYIKHLRQAKVNTAKGQVKLLEQGVMDYILDVGSAPSETDGLEILVRNINNSKKWNGKYMPNIPLDPWGNPYVYRNPGVEEEFAILSYGADGKEGGTGFDADISNETLSENANEETVQ